jgi:hypothetical protein
MGSVRSDQDVRCAARTLGIDEGTLRDLLNTANPDELLQRAARAVVDDHRALADVARTFRVNEKHPAEAVWYLKQNNAREERQQIERETKSRNRQFPAGGAMSSHKSSKEIKRAANNMGVDERWLRNLLETPDHAEFMEQAIDLALSGRGSELVARGLGIDEKEFHRQCVKASEQRKREEAERRRAEEERRKRMPPSWLEDPPS